ncbi:hypothetical protein HYPSUDRAFT_205475 [Hypholoma sublateritium FD-334 SS-4]|uniref:Uncharacterized protein n=1 Tax=Hypholoma sublateritium (strain FD-334 SS-4) TaxID=945553 RepID=A0A0D2KUL4_HYPSF|nr:hypothetical protein HYPSUDRAFT_205475 [Hypholoma sublateritium FD-334 SS-4]
MLVNSLYIDRIGHSLATAPLPSIYRRHFPPLAPCRRDPCCLDGVFSDEVLAIDTTQSTKLVTEPYFDLPNIQGAYDYPPARCLSPLLTEALRAAVSPIPYGDLFALFDKPPTQCTLVIDAGFNFKSSNNNSAGCIMMVTRESYR